MKSTIPESIVRKACRHNDALFAVSGLSMMKAHIAHKSDCAFGNAIVKFQPTLRGIVFSIKHSR